jgi:hypothetical protein
MNLANGPPEGNSILLDATGSGEAMRTLALVVALFIVAAGLAIARGRLGAGGEAMIIRPLLVGILGSRFGPKI